MKTPQKKDTGSKRKMEKLAKVGDQIAFSQTVFSVFTFYILILQFDFDMTLKLEHCYNPELFTLRKCVCFFLPPISKTNAFICGPKRHHPLKCSLTFDKQA